MGRVHEAIIKYLSDGYDFYWYDCHCQLASASLWHHDGWRKHDIILSNTIIVNGHMELLGWHQSEWVPPAELLQKFLVVVHAPVLGYPTHWEEINERYKNGPVFGASCPEGVRSVRARGLDCALVPCGVDLDVFSVQRKPPEKIKNVGFVGKPEVFSPDLNVKRPDMFKEIAQRTGLDYTFIHGQPHSLGSSLYEGVDLIISCSEFESGPLGIFEAAACGIPSITTPTGNAASLASIKTFNTTDEAVALIDALNRNSEALREYTRKLSAEVRANWGWAHLCKKYWSNLFERRWALRG